MSLQLGFGWGHSNAVRVVNDYQSSRLAPHDIVADDAPSSSSIGRI